MSPETIIQFLDGLQRITAGALALLIVLALLTERLIPKGRLDEMRAQRDALIEKVQRHDADQERRLEERIAHIDGRVEALSGHARVRGPPSPD